MEPDQQMIPFSSSRVDPGLSLLLPLYHFLQNACREVVHKILVDGFHTSLFIQQNLSSQCASKPKAKVTVNTPLHSLLYQIQELGNSQEQKHKRKKGNGGNNKQQAESQNLQRNHLLHDIKKNEDILSQMTVQDLLFPHEEVFRKLKDLDLIFVINLITNDILHFQFPDSVLDSLFKLKDIRTCLFHPRFHFSIEEFEEKLNLLYELVCTLCKYLKYSSEDQENINCQERTCRENARSSHQKASDVFEELVREVHQYYAPTSCYVVPKIIKQSDLSVVEDLGRLISSQKNLTSSSKKQPILLCGPCGIGKTATLQNLAYSLSQETAEGKPSLVLHLRECSSLNKHSVAGRKEAEDFWEKVYRSITELAPNTVNRYGVEGVRVVINLYINDIVFLVDWELDILDKLCSEMQRGSWVLAYQKTHFHSPDWCILTIEAFEESHIMQFLEKYEMLHGTNVISMYKKCDYCNILALPEMLYIFCEMNANLIINSDFEMIDQFVKKKMSYTCSNNLDTLSELAFVSICKKRSSLSAKDINGVGLEFCKLFLVEYLPKCYRFIHQIVQDFLAARYVVHNPNKACKDWLDNVRNFKRVFRFACSVWSQDKKTIGDNINHIQKFLVALFCINRTKLGKSHNHGSSGTVEPMDVDEESSKEKKKWKHKKVFENPVKDPFTEWDFLIQLDDACSGQRECLRLFAKLLSCIPYWDFKVDSLNERKLRRIDKILNKVELNDRPPVVIRLECLTNIDLLIALWDMLKNIKGLHHRAHVKIRLKRDKVKNLGPDKLAEIPKSIVNADCAFYIKEFEGPLFCSDIPDVFKCRSFQKLKNLDVSVYDIPTFKEVLLCDKLPTMESATVKLFLNTRDIDFSSVSNLKLPKHMDLKLILKDFPKIQKFINQLENPLYLSSLSIHDLCVSDSFKLDLSRFEKLNTLYLICRPNQDNQASSKKASVESPESMSIDDSELETCPRSSWMFVMMMNLNLPPKLERLMLRNMDFYNDSNNYLLLNIFSKCNTERLMILDSQVTLKGVRKVLISLTTNFDSVEQLESMTKKMRMERENAIEAIAVFAKKPRLPKELRMRRQKNKPPGKELIITSNAGLCGACQSFPCICPGQEIEDNRETLEDIVCLIEDIYYYDILSFTFVSNLNTIRKDLCGDLRVTCTLTELTDASLNLTDPSSQLFKLFHRLAVAQSISFRLTKLTQEGIITLINHFKGNKKSVSDGLIEPFSVTIESAYHYKEEKNLKTFFKFLLKEKCLASFNFWCTCDDKCYWIKKTYMGQIFYNNKLQNIRDLEEEEAQF